jgi:hypothetical protein
MGQDGRRVWKIAGLDDLPRDDESDQVDQSVQDQKDSQQVLDHDEFPMKRGESVY